MAKITSADLLNEVLDKILERVYPSLINLKSFETKDLLNPKFWQSGSLNPTVRKNLISIAKLFYLTLDIDWVKPIDLIFVGSLASYNWSKYSDIDLHLVMNLSLISENTEFASNFLYSKKNEWNSLHEALNMFGYPVELYVQDINDPNASNGVYSIKHDRWIKIPSSDKMIIDKPLVKTQAAKIINKIDFYCDVFPKIHNPRTLLKLRDKAYNLFDSIVQGRRDGIKELGEAAPGNIVFKILRRTGHIGKLKDLKMQIYDKMLSVEESLEDDSLLEKKTLKIKSKKPLNENLGYDELKATEYIKKWLLTHTSEEYLKILSFCEKASESNLSERTRNWDYVNENPQVSKEQFKQNLVAFLCAYGVMSGNSTARFIPQGINNDLFLRSDEIYMHLQRWYKDNIGK